jgi:predicted dehydrogenase
MGCFGVLNDKTQVGMVEKPHTTFKRDTEELVELAEEKDLNLMVGHTFTFYSAVNI